MPKSLVICLNIFEDLETIKTLIIINPNNWRSITHNLIITHLKQLIKIKIQIRKVAKR